MNIGIFVHSQSGHSSKLALAVTHKLREKGHDVSVELLRPVGKPKAGSKSVHLRTIPEVDEFEFIMFGGPVWGLKPSPVIMSFIDQVENIKGKKTLCFTTSFFPTKFSEQRVQSRLTDLIESRGATVLPGVSLCWGILESKKRIDDAVEKICEEVAKAV